MLLCVCASVRLCVCAPVCLVAWLLGCSTRPHPFGQPVHTPLCPQCNRQMPLRGAFLCGLPHAFRRADAQTCKRANVKPAARKIHPCPAFGTPAGGSRKVREVPARSTKDRLLAQLRWGLALKRHEIIARSAARRFNRPHWLCSYSACALRFLLPAPRRIHAGRHPKKRRQP